MQQQPLCVPMNEMLNRSDKVLLFVEHEHALLSGEPDFLDLTIVAEEYGIIG